MKIKIDKGEISYKKSKYYEQYKYSIRNLIFKNVALIVLISTIPIIYYICNKNYTVEIYQLVTVLCFICMCVIFCHYQINLKKYINKNMLQKLFGQDIIYEIEEQDNAVEKELTNFWENDKEIIDICKNLSFTIGITSISIICYLLVYLLGIMFYLRFNGQHINEIIALCIFIIFSTMGTFFLEYKTSEWRKDSYEETIIIYESPILVDYFKRRYVLYKDEMKDF